LPTILVIVDEVSVQPVVIC